ncbi:DNA polymerase Y family protein [Mesorhizobium denitrificans]|uniref:DNA polymerase Y family protein n=1 Tax=Mesorhizobium denitrificans TaxID=2294114 RepID=A0A371XJ98_9HYPH|nr:DNA polymerase Y family protein [Mesorhizobium denitrificans]
MQENLKKEQSDPPPALLQQTNEQRRYLALWFPFLPTDRQFRTEGGARDETPLVLTDKEHGALKIVAGDERALALGLVSGMTLADARARVPSIRVLPVDEAADGRLVKRLALACEMFTPLVALDPPHGLMLDVTGCAHLFGGEEGLCKRVRQLLVRVGIKVKMSLAGTPDAARALARFGKSVIVLPGMERRAVATLPIAALEARNETTVSLSRAGLKSIGDVSARPLKVLAARFGQPMVDRLKRILGEEDIRITPLRAPPDCIAERQFAEPIGEIDSILSVLSGLAREASVMLERRGLGGRLFEASFFRSDGIVRRLHVETAGSARDPDSILRLLRLKIETLADPLDPGFGFDLVRLSVLQVEAFRQPQKSLDGQQQDESAVAMLVDRLVARQGSGKVLRCVARDSHDPELASGFVPVGSPVVSAEWPEPEKTAPPARPLTLFEPPQTIEAMAEVPDGAPVRFRWRRVLHEVARAEGPERIAAEWWHGEHSRPTRDYYRVEDSQGRRFWLFREGLYERNEGERRWFLHGLFA